MYRERQRLEINDVPLSENFLCETYPQYRPYSRRSKLSMTSKTSPSLLISEDTPYARGFRSRNVRASEKHLFPGLRRSARYLRNAPLCKLRGRFFLFYIFSTPPPPSAPSPPPRLFRCYRKPLNSWSFRGREQDEGRGGYKRPLSRMHKRGNRAGARCKFITHVCRAFVRVRLFVKSNQILSNAYSRHFYKSSIVEAERIVAMRSFSSIVFYSQYSSACA